MRGKMVLLLAGVLFFFSACVPPPALTKRTMSGYPETVFKNSDAEMVRGKIVQGCLNQGKMVEESSTSQVVCSSEITGTLERMDATLMLNGNAYSSSPREKIRFIISKDDAGIKVTAQPTMELQMAGGATRSTSVTYTGKLNIIQAGLDSISKETMDAPKLYGPRITP